MSKYSDILACDFETYHIKDFEQDNVDVRIVGNELHIFKDGVDTKEIPSTRVKCAGMIRFSADNLENINGVEYIKNDILDEYCVDDLDSFLCLITTMKKPLIIFHNLKFDESYIASAVMMAGGELRLSNKWKVTCKERTMGPQGRIYKAVYTFKDTRPKHAKIINAEFRDSAKIFPERLESLAKMVGLEKGKEALTPGMNDEIREYCKQDCRICGLAMIYYFNKVRNLTNGSKKFGWLTAGSTAYNLWLNHLIYERHISREQYKAAFPSDGHPDWSRECYRGATPLLDQDIIWKKLSNVFVLDVNSMYPYQMKTAKLPIGRPMPLNADELEHFDYNIPGYVWMARVLIHAKIKSGHRPCFLLKRKNDDGSVLADELEVDDFVYICDVDFKLLRENYDIDYLQIIDGVKYHAKVGIASEFIDFWYKIKQDSKKSGNKGLEKFAKLVLNSLYGKFGSNPERMSYQYVMKDGMLRIVEVGCENHQGFGLVGEVGYYLPWAIWITANARYLITRAINAIGWEHVCYTDTDSLHIHGIDYKTVEKRLNDVGIICGEKNLGDFKLETKHDIYGVYVRNKGYAHFFMSDGKIEEMKMAGLNEWSDDLTVDTFNKDTPMYQNKTYRIRGGAFLIRKRIDICNTSVIKVSKRKGMTHKQSDERDKEVFRELWEEYAD